MEELALDELVAPMHFSPQLEAAIQEVMPSTDPLDAADFNPTAHINRLFPNEESLSQVDAHVSGLQDRMRELDEEVLRTVRQQTSAGSSARKDLENAKASVGELFFQVREIKAKAEQSEEMVHEICHDIKSLDYAKRHLTLTITALKRLQMLVSAPALAARPTPNRTHHPSPITHHPHPHLHAGLSPYPGRSPHFYRTPPPDQVTAVEQLSVMARERMYAEAANLLQVLLCIAVHSSHSSTMYSSTMYAEAASLLQVLLYIAVHGSAWQCIAVRCIAVRCTRRRLASCRRAPYCYALLCTESAAVLGMQQYCACRTAPAAALCLQSCARSSIYYVERYTSLAMATQQCHATLLLAVGPL